MATITIDKGRTNVITADLGIDVSADEVFSEIRVGKDPDSALIAAWEITYLNDGSDGKIIMTIDDSVTKAVDVKKGFMDIMRISDGEPLSVIDDFIIVTFKETITTNE